MGLENCFCKNVVYGAGASPTVFHVTTLQSGNVTQNKGSQQGGSLLWIKGEGFSRDGFNINALNSDINMIKLARGRSIYDCSIQYEYATDTRLACYTPAMPTGDYLVRIYIQGQWIPLSHDTAAENEKFWSSASNTPYISNISPQEGLPQRLISLSGDFKTSCYTRNNIGCLNDNTAVISRIYIGGQICNLIDPTTNAPYAPVSSSSLQCRFESNEVGIFNVTMIVSNEFGRSFANYQLYRLSATGYLYNLRAYAVISKVTPSNGSTQGGTILTIQGQYFGNSQQYPLTVNVGGEPCTILNFNLTTIQCQTLPTSTINRTYYHGGRGLHAFYENTYYDLTNLGNASLLRPSINASKTWLNEASYTFYFNTSATVWLVGYLRPMMNVTLTFQLNTNVDSILYLSKDANPENIAPIANRSSSQSSKISLIANTSYYMVCIGSLQSGQLSLSISTKMDEALSTVSNDQGSFETQQIVVGSSIFPEYQRITYANSTPVQGVSEIQTILSISNTFQIGFRGVYTAILNSNVRATDLQMALNDLPTIYPYQVAVGFAYASFTVTFPVEMGDVPSLMIISPAYEIPINATERRKGIASGTKLAFELDGLTTEYFDFWNNAITNDMLLSKFLKLFTIQCPLSLYSKDADSSIIDVLDFEENNDPSVFTTDKAFCGRQAFIGNYGDLRLFRSLPISSNYICFAYKLPNGVSIRIAFTITADDDYYPQGTLYTQPSLTDDGLWHYYCLDIKAAIIEADHIYDSFIDLIQISEIYFPQLPSGVMIDTVTLRRLPPLAYQGEYYVRTSDRSSSSSSSCTFPFVYNGQTYNKCTLNANNLPICVSNVGQVNYCGSSSIEGVQRLYPKYQLLNNAMNIGHNMGTRTIDISFRYTECNSPTLIKPIPSTLANVVSITTASKRVGGFYDIMFDGQTYASIPVNINPANMIYLLQSFPNFGYIDVNRTGECAQWSYMITWLSKGKQPVITISNTIAVTPSGTNVTSTVIQKGSDGNLFYQLPNDMLRTYSMKAQVEVLVSGYPSYCSNVDNSCEFQFTLERTPIVTSIALNGNTLTITGNGFNPSNTSNTILIGEQGSCVITFVNTTVIICVITNAPSGRQSVRVNVDGKGFALNNFNTTINFPLSLTSFLPIEGGVGGGYNLTIYGSGFSSKTVVYIDGNLCTNPQITNISLMACIVPMSTVPTTRQVMVTINDGFNAVSASTLFTYNTTDIPTIVSIVPRVFTVTGGLMNVTGTGFDNASTTLFIGNQSISILSVSSTQIQANLSQIPPGIYPVTILTSKGFARPRYYIESRFYVQQIYPRAGSIYGGMDVYVRGDGFNNLTKIQFRSRNNRTVPCSIKEIQSYQIICRTTSFVQRATVTPTGFHPLYGTGYAWSSPYLTVQQGTIVTWEWQSSILLNRMVYKVEQLADMYGTMSVGGFNSGEATEAGSFSYQFNSLGTYYYWSPNVDLTRNIAIRGVVNVIPAESEILTLEAQWQNFTAQTCVFPFIYNSVNYTQCTSVNDTQAWCSPTSVYNGQRLYCAQNISLQNSTCSSGVSNSSLCNQTVPVSLNAMQYLSIPCMIESISSVLPTNGGLGTLLTITGTSFNGSLCDYDIEIGSMYHCPLLNKTSNQLTCIIAANSTLETSVRYIVRVFRNGYGYLRNLADFRFQFQASVLDIFPRKGSKYGGTRITVVGDGFIPNNTKIFIFNNSYTSFELITASKIIFLTAPELNYWGLNLPIYVIIGNSQAQCLASACSFNWDENLTPLLDSVVPATVSGPTNLTLSGRNLLIGNTTYSDVHLTINNRICIVMATTNRSIDCVIDGLEAGTHRIFGSINGVGNMYSSVSITSQGGVFSISPTISSIYGGAQLTIRGNGFPNSATYVQVTVGSKQCPIVRTTGTEILCVIPPQEDNPSQVTIGITVNSQSLVSSFVLNYNATVTPNVTSVSIISSSAPIKLLISGYNFVVGNTSVYIGSYTCTVYNISLISINCMINSQLPAGHHQVVVYVDSIGKSNSDNIYNHTLKVTKVTPSEGSYGGGLLITIDGDGFNASGLTVSICNKTCSSVTVSSNAQLTCITPQFSFEEVNNSCSLTVTIDDLTASSTFTYRRNLTATVTSISPLRGGTGGGTLITINGDGFPNSSNDVSVKIATANCSVQTINRTCIVCQTNKYSGTNLQAPVMVLISGSGYAFSSVYFQYMNLWSSRWTWGGNPPPEAGTIVSVERGETIFLDISTPILKALVIENATLIFDDSNNIELNAEYIIIVNNGRLQVGTEANPFQHRAVITMYGNLRSKELPLFGAKVLGIRWGTVEMFGKKIAQTWTKLGETAVNGSSTVVLQQPVDWSINSEIILATTGDRFSQGQTELRRIMNISSDRRTLTLDKPLNYTHLGLSQNLNLTTIEVRGEVGLLTHNIIIQGSINTDTQEYVRQQCPMDFTPNAFTVQTCYMSQYDEVGSDQFGAIIMITRDESSNSVVLRLSNVELYNVGQAFRLGRHPIRFFSTGYLADSYIKSCSIHYSFNRAINIQASHGIAIENNVIYNIRGNAIYLEDGIEKENRFRGNLIAFVQGSSSLRNEDYTPAGFWLSNPNNVIENNALAGCTHYGYLYQLLSSLSGSSWYTNMYFRPDQQPFGTFYNNSVHSTSLHGLWIYPKYTPTVSGNYWDETPNVAVVDKLTSWRNQKGMESYWSRTLLLRDAVIFDNADTGIGYLAAVNHQVVNPTTLRPTFYNPNNGTSVVDSIIVGDVNLSITPVVPSTAGLIIMNDRGFLVQNVSFINFPSNQTPAIIGSNNNIEQCINLCGGWLTKFSNVSFHNVAVRVKFPEGYQSLYYDTDGTLSGKNESMVVVANNIPAVSLFSCAPASYFVNAFECPRSMGFWVRLFLTRNRYEWYSTINYGDLLVTDENNRTASISWRQEDYPDSNGYMIALVVNRTYQLTFRSPQEWIYIRYWTIVYDMSPGDFIIIQHPMNVRPDYGMTKQSFQPLSGLINDHGDWFYNDTARLFSYIIKYSTTDKSAFDLTTLYTATKCQCPNCTCTTTTATTATTQTTLPTTVSTRCNGPPVRYWSVDEHWIEPQSYPNWNRTKPTDGQDIYISDCIWLIIDYPLPRIRSLKIDGVLEFQPGRNHIMYVDNIIITETGELRAGTSDNAFNGSIDIILTNSGPIRIPLPFYIPMAQPRMIAVRGSLRLYGLKPNIIWTRIARTAESRQNVIQLSQLVNWRVGDEIVITTTDISITHTERHRIAAIENGSIIRTQAPLLYTHHVLQISARGRRVQVAAAVGLLTRNIRVRADNYPSSLSGLRIFISGTVPWWKSSACISSVQFIGFGQLDDSPSTDLWSGIYINQLGEYDRNKPTFIDSCSFDGGNNAAIAMVRTNGISITSNLIYNTYRSAIVITGRNNAINNNLVTTIKWVGWGLSTWAAEFNMNFDAAITSRSAISVIMQNNLVAGVDRLAFQIQGGSCTGISTPNFITNDYSNNEAHSAMSGVNIWPSDRGFVYDLQCVLIKDFTVYKAWYYGFYINTPRNITIKSCTSVDNQVGYFTFIVGPSALNHRIVRSRVVIQDSVVIGSVTPNSCNDTLDFNSMNIKSSLMAKPTVSNDTTINSLGSRAGVVFPIVSQRNGMPVKPWTELTNYPSLDGSMFITSTLFAYFNDVCDRHDVAIQASQNNDDGHFPITLNSISVFNLSLTNRIFNGQPKLESVADRCGGMDCDALKKCLVIDNDGSMFQQQSSIFSYAEALWNDSRHGVNDTRIPAVVLTDQNGRRKNISGEYPWRGINRNSTCSLQPSWGMYKCDFTANYRILVIESMDSDTENRPLSPVAIMSRSGYIDLLNGPPYHGTCNGFLSCRKRISTFMAIVQSGQTYEIYYTYDPPTNTRFRLIDGDSSIRCVIAVYYNSLQRIDVYANDSYVSPTNRRMDSAVLMLSDAPNNVSLSSSPGANYFDRDKSLLYFLIDGYTSINLKVSIFIMPTFDLPPMTINSLYENDVATKLAALLGIDRSLIRRVKIVWDSSSTGRRKRAIAAARLSLEMSDEPQNSLTETNGVRDEMWANIAATVINIYQTGQMQIDWKTFNVTNDAVPQQMSIQEPFDYSTVNLSVISKIDLYQAPAECREQSACTIQPIIVAYDSNNTIIQKLGSKDRPWQIKATVINQSNLVLQGSVANYSNGSAKFTLLSLPSIGTYKIRFSFIQPDGVNSSILQTTNFTVETSIINVTRAIIDGLQVNNVYNVSVNDTFSISIMPIDKITRLQLASVQWQNWTWNSFNITLLPLPKFNRPGSLTRLNSSKLIVNMETNTVTITGLAIKSAGMYMLNIQLSSSNLEYIITLTSNSILVTMNSNSWVTDVNDLSCNITFAGDYDALNASNQLEMKRAMIYNYLLSIGMPLISDIVLARGSIISLFQVDTLAQDISTAMTSIMLDPTVIPGLNMTSVNINGRSYSVKSLATTNNTKDSGSSSGLVAGVVVSIVVCLLIIGLVVVAYVVHKKRNARNKNGTHGGNPSAPIDAHGNIGDGVHRRENFVSPPIHGRWSLPFYRIRELLGLGPANRARPADAELVNLDEFENREQMDRVVEDMRKRNQN